MQYPWPEPPEFGTSREIAEGVFWVRLPLPMALDHVNCYVLDDGDGWTVVDTGFSTRKTRAMWDHLLDTTFKGKPVTRVIATHHHPDHIGLAGWFQEEKGAELWCSRTSWLMARMLFLDYEETHKPENLLFWRRSGMDAEIYDKRVATPPYNFSDVLWNMPLGFRRIQEGETIEIGGRVWDIHMGNGHSPEHATFWSRECNLVLTGDQVLSSISPNLGVYATEPEADTVGEWLASCEKLASLARVDHLALGGHKLPFTGLPHRMQLLIENHHHALERLLEFLSIPRTAAECFQPLFKRTIKSGEYGLALAEAVAHMNHLWKLGQVTREIGENDAYYYRAV